MPVPGQSRVAGEASERTLANPLFPCRVYFARAAGCTGPSEQARDVWSVVPSDRGNPAGDCSRSATPRSTDRLFLPICIVSCPAAASPWRTTVGWPAVPASSYPCAYSRSAFETSISGNLRNLEEAYAAGKLQFYGALQPLSDPRSFAHYLAPLSDRDLVVYAKTPFGRPERVLDYPGRYTHRPQFPITG